MSDQERLAELQRLQRLCDEKFVARLFPEDFDRAKSILHHLHIDDRHPGNGPSKVIWSDELETFVVRAEDLAPVLDMYVNLLPTFDGDGDC